MRFSIPKFNCDIVLSQPDLAGLRDFLNKTKDTYSSCAIFTSPTPYGHYYEQVKQVLEEQKMTVHLIHLPEGEGAKTLSVAEDCWSKMHSFGMDRKSLAIALGGGAILDVTGFVSACYMRGIEAVYLPTTLLAMVDASIGGKTALNLAAGKNVIGAWHHPRLVVVAPHFLKSLPTEELSSGLAEVIKAGMIRDADLIEFLESYTADILAGNQKKLETAIARACKIKVEVVRIDEKEKNLRSILNYGHTFGHALETATGYARYRHGEAVSIGMHCAAKVSHAMGFVDAEFIRRQTSLCTLAGLPIDVPGDLHVDNLIDLMVRDKKNVSGKITLILPRKVGKVDKVSDVDPALIARALT